MEEQLLKKVKELYNVLIVVNSLAQDLHKSKDEQLTTINFLTASQLSKPDNFIF